jgi:hypothetical protein
MLLKTSQGRINNSLDISPREKSTVERDFRTQFSVIAVVIREDSALCRVLMRGI